MVEVTLLHIHHHHATNTAQYVFLAWIGYQTPKFNDPFHIYTEVKWINRVILSSFIMYGISLLVRFLVKEYLFSSLLLNLTFAIRLGGVSLVTTCPFVFQLLTRVLVLNPPLRTALLNIPERCGWRSDSLCSIMLWRLVGVVKQTVTWFVMRLNWDMLDTTKCTIGSIGSKYKKFSSAGFSGIWSPRSKACSPKENTFEVKINMSIVLSDSKCFALLMEHLLTEFSDEILLSLVEMEQLKVHLKQRYLGNVSAGDNVVEGQFYSEIYSMTLNVRGLSLKHYVLWK